MKSEDVQKKLFVLGSDKYGDKYIEHLLEQYKIYIESAEKIAIEDRKRMSSFWASIPLLLPCSALFLQSQLNLKSQ